MPIKFLYNKFKFRRVYIFLLFFFFGIIFYLYYNQWIIISFPGFSRYSANQQITQKKPIELFLWSHQQWKKERVEIIWYKGDTRKQIEQVISRWLAVCEEEKIIKNRVSLQSVIPSIDSREFFISFDRSFFDLQNSTYDNWMILESLLKTIRESETDVLRLRFLLHHQLWEDEYIDFSFSWPIHGYIENSKISANSNAYCLFSSNKLEPFTIMIDPAGDAKHVGRVIDDTFERGITLQYAQRLKKIIEEENKNINIVIGRMPGEILDPLHVANYANRLDVDLFISINFYQSVNREASLILYQYIKEATDLWGVRYKPLSFVAFDHVHLISAVQSDCVRSLMFEYMKKKLSVKMISAALPFLRLKGIKAPSVGIEIGLAHKTEWSHYLEPLAEFLVQCSKSRTSF